MGVSFPKEVRICFIHMNGSAADYRERLRKELGDLRDSKMWNLVVRCLA